MIETLTVRIDQKLNEAFRHKCQALNEPVDKIVERLIETFLDESVPQADAMLCDAPKIDQFVKELVKDIKVSGDEPFFGDLTYDEYFALSDSQREALWSQGYRQELSRKQEKEKEANPDAIPAGQGRSAEIRRRLRKQRTRNTSNQ